MQNTRKHGQKAERKVGPKKSTDSSQVERIWSPRCSQGTLIQKGGKVPSISTRVHSPSAQLGASDREGSDNWCVCACPSLAVSMSNNFFRLAAHLSNGRPTRSRCREWYYESVPPMSREEVDALHEADVALWRETMRAGQSRICFKTRRSSRRLIDRKSGLLTSG